MKPSSVLSFNIRDKNALHSAYMPHVTGGGMFVPTERTYRLSDEVFILLGLPDSQEKLPVAGNVVWITPPNAMGSRVQGIGIRFKDDENGRLAKSRIEALIAGMPTRPTHTM
ncbi:MAG TPA: PilZ domain-containing protein [Burkholderiales bacterium]|nr:PilZ domain-containing protein [Burkholderiales bacterium]